MLVFTYWYRKNSSYEVIPRFSFCPFCSTQPIYRQQVLEVCQESSLQLTLGPFPFFLEPVFSLVKMSRLNNMMSLLSGPGS